MRLLRFRQECSNAAANAVLQALDTLNHDFLCPSIVKNDGVWFACYEHRRNAAAQNAAAPTATPTGLFGNAQATLFGFGSSNGGMFQQNLRLGVSSQSRPVVSWFVKYLQDLQSEVRARPRGATVLNSALNAKYATIGCAQCSTCAERVHSDMSVFVQVLASDVETAVSKVSRVSHIFVPHFS